MFRFAPSPTGDMHIGNLRVAIFNFIMAQKLGERFIIRIEDTDKARNIEGKDKEILEILEIFGISYDEVMYQSENIRFHQQLAAKLLQDKNAFCCFCSKEELAQKKELAKENKIAYRYDNTCTNLPDSEVIDNPKPFVVRLKKPLEKVAFVDEIKGELSFTPEEIDSFVTMRKDNLPTYNFACAVDDMLSDIGFIIRGEDRIPNTPKQMTIHKFFGYEKKLKYAHLPILLDENGKKMSKRDESSSVKWLLSLGLLPSAIANYLILIGNNTPKEIFTIKEAIEFFDIKNISKSPTHFDLAKLRQVNREYIKLIDEVELSSYFGFKDKQIGLLAKLYTEETSTINEIKEKIDAIFAPKTAHENIKEEFELLRNIAKKAPYIEHFEEYKRYLMNESEIRDKTFLKALRILLTGREQGPNLSDLYPLIKSYLQEIIK